MFACNVNTPSPFLALLVRDGYVVRFVKDIKHRPVWGRRRKGHNLKANTSERTHLLITQPAQKSTHAHPRAALSTAMQGRVTWPLCTQCPLLKYALITLPYVPRS